MGIKRRDFLKAGPIAAGALAYAADGNAHEQTPSQTPAAKPATGVKPS